MPRGDRVDASGRKRYAAVVEKGENAWKREWSSFMSGVNLKRLRDGTSGVSLKASADIERHLETSATSAPAQSPNTDAAGGDIGVNSDGIPLNAGAASASFSYLFSSPAERRAERDARERAEQERRRIEKRERMAKADPLSVLSKHQRALHDAVQRGLQMVGMNRKARREFLHLTVSEAQRKAEAQSREFKLHDLMDEKLAWYQQGPYPVDLIAEKLVRRKAEKKAKQLGLKYNYLTPHASWLAKRAQRRRESVLVGLGKRLIFHDEDDQDEAGAEMTVTDPLRKQTVPLRDMGLLLQPTMPVTCNAVSSSVAAEGEETAEETAEEAAAVAMVKSAMQAEKSDEEAEAEDEAKEEEEDEEEEKKGKALSSQVAKAAQSEVDPLASGDGPAPSPHRRRSDVAAAPPARVPDTSVLQDPFRQANSFIRRIVRDRATAVAIQQLNRTTTYLSSGLVKGPSLLPEDTAAAAAAATGLPVQTITGSGVAQVSKHMARPSSSSASASAQLKRPTRASAAPSFSAYAEPAFRNESE